jgi:hypothetical protein
MFLEVPLEIIHKVAEKQDTFVNNKIGFKEPDHEATTNRIM